MMARAARAGALLTFGVALAAGCASNRVAEEQIAAAPPLFRGFEEGYGCSYTQPYSVRGRIRARIWYPDRLSEDIDMVGDTVELTVIEAKDLGAPETLYRRRVTTDNVAGFEFEGVPAGGLADLRVIDDRIAGRTARVFHRVPTDSLFLGCWTPSADRDYVHLVPPSPTPPSPPDHHRR